VAAGLVEKYRDGFRDRVHAMRHPGQEILDRPGILGLIGRSAEALDGRVLVTDDRAHDLLVERVSELRARVVYVFDDARACSDVMVQAGGYRGTRCTAMVCSDLDAVTELALPGGLVRRPVNSDDPTSIPLPEAAAAALRSDPRMAPTSDLDGFVDYLRSIPGTTYLAAVDDESVVRATAAVATWGPTAGIFFVNTDPAWRGRGIGTAMTAAALRAGAALGATRACLDASELGLSLYVRLGFEVAGPLTQFVRDGLG
jgi:GNAT superfamily N-acetyltransferase